MEADTVIGQRPPALSDPQPSTFNPRPPSPCPSKSFPRSISVAVNVSASGKVITPRRRSSAATRRRWPAAGPPRGRRGCIWSTSTARRPADRSMSTRCGRSPKRSRFPASSVAAYVTTPASSSCCTTWGSTGRSSARRPSRNPNGSARWFGGSRDGSRWGSMPAMASSRPPAGSRSRRHPRSASPSNSSTIRPPP